MPEKPYKLAINFDGLSTKEKASLQFFNKIKLTGIRYDFRCLTKYYVNTVKAINTKTGLTPGSHTLLEPNLDIKYDSADALNLAPRRKYHSPCANFSIFVRPMATTITNLGETGATPVNVNQMIKMPWISPADVDNTLFGNLWFGSENPNATDTQVVNEVTYSIVETIYMKGTGFCLTNYAG